MSRCSARWYRGWTFSLPYRAAKDRSASTKSLSNACRSLRSKSPPTYPSHSERLWKSCARIPRHSRTTWRHVGTVTRSGSRCRRVTLMFATCLFPYGLAAGGSQRRWTPLVLPRWRPHPWPWHHRRRSHPRPWHRPHGHLLETSLATLLQRLLSLGGAGVVPTLA